MTIMSDKRIKKLCVNDSCLGGFQPMIEPFCDRSVRYNEFNQKIISYGLSSKGYDIRLSEDIKLFSNIKSAVVDPLDISNDCFVDLKPFGNDNFIVIPPNHYILGVSVEYFKIPKNVIGICLGKSTYARSGLILNCSPLEPEWEGNLVIEISNATSCPVMVYFNQGISQILFDEGEDCSVSYKDRDGKYQGQTGVTLPKG